MSYFLTGRPLFQLTARGLICAPLFAFFVTACTSGPAEKTEENASTEPSTSLWPSLQSPLGTDADLESRIDELMSQMSLEEKVGQMMQAEIQHIEPGDIKKYHLGSVLNGGGSFPNRNKTATAAEWLALAESFYQESIDISDGNIAIPISWGTDAVHGHNNVIGATIFPHNIGLGAAHNAELIQKIGKATAQEVIATGIDWIFAPTLAVAQNDLWGRTYESYSEDPALVAEYATALVTGLQGKLGSTSFLDDKHVVATAKHFLADGGTVNGDDQGNAVMTEQELVNIHNAGYPTAIEAGVQTVMASFSSWNGEKMHGNQYLLTDVLKEQMGFDGFVVGDWNGHAQVTDCTKDSCPNAINAGIDMVMVPYDWKDLYHNTLKQVRAGAISQSRVDDAVRRILRVKLRAGIFEQGPSERSGAGNVNLIGHPEHRAIARQAVRESLVLLKNIKQTLPIHPNATVLVTGDGADNITKQSGGWTISWQGTGNLNSEFPGGTSIYWGIAAAMKQAGGSAILSPDGSYDEKPDVAVVVFGEDPYAEGHGDRDSLEFQPGDKKALKLLKSFKAAGIPTVSIFLSGRPMWVNPELNASDAFVAAWLPGTEAGGIADVLIGNQYGKARYDFKGTLSFSWPKTPLQSVLNPHHPNYDPLFPLGYGLNYTAPNGDIGPLSEQSEGVADANNATINFYVGRALQPWLLHIHNKNHKQILSGAYAVVREGNVSIRTTDKDVQEDALLFTWQNTPLAEIRFTDGPHFDMQPYLEDGMITLDLRVDEFNGSAFELFVVAGEERGPEGVVSLSEWVKNHVGKGWAKVSVPTSCYQDLGADKLSDLFSPVNMRTDGTGAIAIANIKIHKTGAKGISCSN